MVGWRLCGPACHTGWGQQKQRCLPHGPVAFPCAIILHWGKFQHFSISDKPIAAVCLWDLRSRIIKTTPSSDASGVSPQSINTTCDISFLARVYKLKLTRTRIDLNVTSGHLSLSTLVLHFVMPNAGVKADPAFIWYPAKCWYILAAAPHRATTLGPSVRCHITYLIGRFVAVIKVGVKIRKMLWWFLFWLQVFLPFHMLFKAK